MAYETGYAANEFELQERLNAFILSIDGWRKISQPSDFESVYFSSGEDGYKDIYIKTRAGLAEPYANAYSAGDQRDFGDGYTGYLNFFAYQFYPEDGDGYDGYGEAGRFGPWLWWYKMNGKYYYNQRFSITQRNSYNRWDYVGQGGGTFTHDYPPMGTGGSAGTNRSICWDGKRYFYYITYYYSGMFKFDLSNLKTTCLDSWWDYDRQVIGEAMYYVDPITRKEYVWDFTQAIRYAIDNSRFDPMGKLGHIRRWDVDAGLVEHGFQGPEWEYTSDWASNRTGALYDGNRRIYIARGNNSVEWGMYDIVKNEWTTFDYLNNSSCYHYSWTWLDKSITGYDNHRIIMITQNNNRTYRVDIDENTGHPIGSWTRDTDLPYSLTTGAKIFHNKRNRIYYARNGGGTTDRYLYYADIPKSPSSNLSWTYVHNVYFPDDTDGQWNETWYIDGYASRVRTSITDSTKYWFFGTADYITVIARADDIYSWCYMGGVDQLTPETPHALATADIYPGTSVEIPITLLKGEFIIGQTMFIANTVEGGGGWEIGEVENIARKFMPIEKFTIIDVNPGYSITADEIKNTYRTGSRIAYDPQPVGITMDGLDRIQMLNCINTTSTSGGFDMTENIAQLNTVREEVVNGGTSRRTAVTLWPILAVNMGNEQAYSGGEARGILHGVFAASGSAGLSSEDTIVVGSNVYIVLGVPTGKDFVYVFGPIQEG